MQVPDFHITIFSLITLFFQDLHIFQTSLNSETFAKLKKQIELLQHYKHNIIPLRLLQEVRERYENYGENSVSVTKIFFVL